MTTKSKFCTEVEPLLVIAGIGKNRAPDLARLIEKLAVEYLPKSAVDNS